MIARDVHAGEVLNFKYEIRYSNIFPYFIQLKIRELPKQNLHLQWLIDHKWPGSTYSGQHGQEQRWWYLRTEACFAFKKPDDALDFILYENVEIKDLFGSNMELTTDLEVLRERAVRDFLKPGLADLAISIQNEMVQKDFKSSIDRVELLSSLLREDAEYRFEQEIKEFPIEVKLARGLFKNIKEEPSPFFTVCEEWLSENVPIDQYIAFPNNARGQYKDCVFNVYFRETRWAVLFKVACSPT